jgi:hypothetical protein
MKYSKKSKMFRFQYSTETEYLTTGYRSNRMPFRIYYLFDVTRCNIQTYIIASRNLTALYERLAEHQNRIDRANKTCVVHLETWECNPEAEYGTLGFVSPLVTS